MPPGRGSAQLTACWLGLVFSSTARAGNTRLHEMLLCIFPVSQLSFKSSDEAEGFVINIDGYRVKLKYNDYVHIHKALSKLSSVNLIIRSIADDKYDDLLAKLPVAYHDQVKKVATIVVDYINRTEKTIREYFNEAPKNNKKEFMIYVSENIPREYQGYCREL